jgi:hypothetical protein
MSNLYLCSYECSYEMRGGGFFLRLPAALRRSHLDAMIFGGQIFSNENL